MSNKCLIGMATYNNYNMTYLAIKSLLRYTDLENNRLHIIDNASTDGTVDRILQDFPQIKQEQIVVSENDCVSAQWNMFVDRLQESEDFVMVPNDVIFSPNWLEILKEDTYRHDNIICGSPYFPVDLQYDSVINEDFANNFMKIRSNGFANKSVEELENILNQLYNNYEDFCIDFSRRNNSEPPIDGNVTHIILFKNKLFKEHNFRFCEEYCPVYGSMEWDVNCELNNLGYYRIASSRCYINHWISGSAGITKTTLSEKQKCINKNNLHLLKKWIPISDSAYFSNLKQPSNIPNYRNKYYKFKKNEILEEDNIARNRPGIKYTSYESLSPGKNYFDQLREGSIIRADNISYKVIGRTEDTLTISNKNNDYLIIDKEWFNKYKFHIDYYWREEEEKYFGIGHMDFLLEK